MNLEQQVCSLDLAKRLNELGVKYESLLWWNGALEWVEKEVSNHGGGISRVMVEDEKLTWNISRVPSDHPSCKASYAAFTVAELGEMLKSKYVRSSWVWLPDLEEGLPKENKWHCIVGGQVEGFTADREADARAKMLIYLIENKLITV